MTRIMSNNSGSYVDIGAGAPIWGSNTYLFYRKGWSGITVDPIGFNISLHKIVRPRDHCYQALVSTKAIQKEFCELIPSELSTTDEDIVSTRIKNGATILRKIKIPTITLGQIYDTHQLKRPAILSVDVEGAEMEVLQSNDWSRHTPDLICIEELSSPLIKSDISDFLRENNYSLIIYNGVSSIYYWNKSQHIRF